MVKFNELPEGVQAELAEAQKRFTEESIGNIEKFFIASGLQDELTTFKENGISIDSLKEYFSKYLDVLNACMAVTPIEYVLQDDTGEFIKLITDIFREGMKEAGKDLTPTQAEAVNEVLKSKLPDSYFITNNKLSNEITRDFLNNGEFSLAVIKPNKKGEVCTYNSLSYEGSDISITGRQQFTAYDRTVHNAVCTLFVAGNDVVTPQMVYRTFNGMTDSEYISPQAIGAVTKSLDKSRFTRLKVDFTAEAKARHLSIDKAVIDSNLLHAKVVTVSASGREISAFKILETPALYEYAQFTKQVISVPLPLLDTREATRNTEEIIPIKEYLIRRIEIMKHNDTSNKIVYDTIFNETSVNLTSQSQKNRMRNYITSILTLWQKRDKYIKGFKEYKEGKTFKGIEITY